MKTIITVRRTAYGVPYKRTAKYEDNALVEVIWTRITEEMYQQWEEHQQQGIEAQLNAAENSTAE